MSSSYAGTSTDCAFWRLQTKRRHKHQLSTQAHPCILHHARRRTMRGDRNGDASERRRMDAERVRSASRVLRSCALLPFVASFPLVVAAAVDDCACADALRPPGASLRTHALSLNDASDGRSLMSIDRRLRVALVSAASLCALALERSCSGVDACCCNVDVCVTTAGPLTHASMSIVVAAAADIDAILTRVSFESLCCGGFVYA